MRILRVSDAFQTRVDGVLAFLEVDMPSAQRLRRVPIDLIAIAVARECPVNETGIRASLVGLVQRNQ